MRLVILNQFVSFSVFILILIILVDKYGCIFWYYTWKYRCVAWLAGWLQGKSAKDLPQFLNLHNKSIHIFILCLNNSDPFLEQAKMNIILKLLIVVGWRVGLSFKLKLVKVVSVRLFSSFKPLWKALLVFELVDVHQVAITDDFIILILLNLFEYFGGFCRNYYFIII